MESGHTFYRVTREGRLERQAGPGECLKPRDGGYAWLDFVGPSREDLEPLVASLGVHPLSVEDCLDQDQVPKVENFDATTFILVNPYAYAGGKLLTGEVDFIIGRDFLVSVRGRGGASSWPDAEAGAALRREAASVGRGPDFLLHVLLDCVVDGKVLPMQALEAEVEAVEEAVMSDGGRFDLERLVRLRRDLLSLRKSLFHEREILVKVCRRDSPFIGEKAIFHFRDIYDHLTKCFEEADIYREVLSNLAEMNLAMFNNRLARIANRTNASVRRLTIIMTVFMPLSLLAGVGGMSEFTMMAGGSANWKAAYAGLLAAMAVLAAATYALLRRLEAFPSDDD